MRKVNIRSATVRTLVVTGTFCILSMSPDRAWSSDDVATGLGGFEPHNAVVNPLNPSQVAVMQGCTVLISNAFGQDGFPVVWNTNQTSCGGDPSLAFDSQGRLFLTHLSRLPEQSVMAAQIPDLTTSGTYNSVLVSQLNNIGDDKQWLAADANPLSPFRDNLYLVWTEFTNPWQLLFSRSTDQGVTWSTPQALSPADNDGDMLVDEDALDGIDNDGDTLVDEDPPEGDVWPSHVAVGPNGDVYVAYHTNTCDTTATPADEGTTVLLRDGSGGANFAAGIVPFASTPFGPGEATVTCNRQDDPGDFSLGDTIPDAEFWLIGTMQPWILPDPLFPNRVYVVGNDDPDNAYASGDDADVVIARSDDFGQTFTLGRVDHDPGQSFAIMPTAHIDQDGNIVVTWYTNRRQLMNSGSLANDGDPNFLLDLYGTTSRDGGETFINDFRISDAPFDPDVNKTVTCRYGTWNPPATTDCTARIGEYNGVWTVDGLGYASWAGNGTPPTPPFPADGANGMDPYFDVFSMAGAFPDRLEPNESRDFAVVADLGADNTYNEAALTLHTATDEDFFKIVALHSGKLEVIVQFNEVIAPGLAVELQDSAGNALASPTSFNLFQVGSSEFAFAVPVVQGENYFVRVFEDSLPPITAPPQLSYDLTVINRPAPVPFGLDLLASSDSGQDTADDVTNDSTPSILIRADVVDAVQMGIDILTPAEVMDDEPGYALAVFAEGSQIGYATPTTGDSTRWTFIPDVPLNDGLRSITAKIEVFDGTQTASGFSGQSEALGVTIDTVAPGQPPIPDLLASSDSAGISVDNITTIMSPAFNGTVENLALVRILANSVVVGQARAGSTGTYEITVEPLADGVYDITATAEDAAGNFSSASAALQVTIANQSLSLSGASGQVIVDLGDSNLTGYPGIPGGVVGILGIPEVNLDTNGNPLEVSGTGGSDLLTYTPGATDGGSLVLAGRAQVLNFSGVGGAGFTLDPLGGEDQVTVVGTVNDDAIEVVLDSSTTARVNSLLLVVLPDASLERIAVEAGQGTDTVAVTVFDSVNSNVTVAGGVPATNPNRGDLLTVTAASPRPKLLTQSGPVKGSGSVLVSYDRTTENASRVDYVEIEKVAKSK